MTTKKRKIKRSPTDAPLKNVRAAKKREATLKERIKALEVEWRVLHLFVVNLNSRLEKLERKRK